jgi:hypothetical protein
MFTWISKPAVLLLMLMGLAACQPSAGLPGLSSLNMLTARQGTVDVLEGAVRIAGPKGYCPDSDILHSAEDSAVVLLGRCFDDSEAPPALVSVTVGQAGTGLAAEGATLAAFFASAPGRATLSQRGRAGDIRLLSALSSSGVFLMQVQDRASPPYWRGMTSLAGRMVSVRASGPALSPPEGRALVEATIRSLLRANGKS